MWIWFFALFVWLVSAPVQAQGDRERTVDVLEAALKTDPGNADLWIHLGFARRKLEQFEAAAQAFEKAVSLQPQSPEAWFMLGLIYEKLGRRGDALQAWQRFLPMAKDPEKRIVAESHIHQLSQ